MNQTGTMKVVHQVNVRNPLKGHGGCRMVTLFTDYNINRDAAERMARDWKQSNPDLDLTITFTVVDYI